MYHISANFFRQWHTSEGLFDAILLNCFADGCIKGGDEEGMASSKTSTPVHVSPQFSCQQHSSAISLVL